MLCLSHRKTWLVRSGTAPCTAQRNSVLLRGGERLVGSSGQPARAVEAGSALALALKGSGDVLAANVARRTSAALAMVDFSDRDEGAEFRERQRSLPATGRAPMAAGARC